jgi:hypothetical protein
VGAEMAQKDQHSLPARLASLDEQNAFKIRFYFLPWPSWRNVLIIQRIKKMDCKLLTIWLTPDFSFAYLALYTDNFACPVFNHFLKTTF